MQNSGNVRGDLKKGGGMAKSTSLTVQGRRAKGKMGMESVLLWPLSLLDMTLIKEILLYV